MVKVRKYFVISSDYCEDDMGVGATIRAICESEEEATKEIKEYHDTVVESAKYNSLEILEDGFEEGDKYFCLTVEGPNGLEIYRADIEEKVINVYI